MRHGNQVCPRPKEPESKIPILPMRHGNKIQRRRCSPPSATFRSYLWGMETHESDLKWHYLSPIPILPMRHGNQTGLTFIKKKGVGFRSYLWGMETPEFNGTVLDGTSFRSYLWGMETWMVEEKWFRADEIPILPMRHGNRAHAQLTRLRL